VIDRVFGQPGSRTEMEESIKRAIATKPSL
jgi:hypothetical protein